METFQYIVDTHAHLTDSDFDRDREDVIGRAREAGVGAIVTVSETMADAVQNLQLASRYQQLKPAAGLYPTQLDVHQAEEMVAFVHRERDRLVAIGEVGLDHWAVKEEAQREIQREIFLQFIRVAKELGLPLNVHSRAAGKPAIQMLLGNDAKKVQLHAFDGKWGSAMAAVEAGYFFSIPPSVVRSRQKQKLVRQLPMKSLLVETDSPVLGPEPNERNEPANIHVAIKAIAEIKSVSREEVMGAVYENSIQLYGDLRTRPALDYVS